MSYKEAICDSCHTPSPCIESYPLSPQRKKRIAIEALLNRKTQTCIAQENNTTRKNVRHQRDNALEAIDNYFDHDKQVDPDVIFHLPVTQEWIKQLVLALILLARASYRNMIAILNDLFDFPLSLGTINAIFYDAVAKAKEINAAENLSTIGVTANDELFHFGRPILSGIDARSLYCYLLASEGQRDEETWAIHLMDAKDKGLNPQRTIGDDAKGLVSGHKIVFPDSAYHYDNFHLSRELMDLRRFFRNRLKTTISELNAFDKRAVKMGDDTEFGAQVMLARDEEVKARYLSKTLDTLISCMEHDILKKAGPTPKERRELYDFVIDEFRNLEAIEPHRITAVRTTLENKREMALAFSDVMDEKFKVMSEKYQCSVDTIWDMCKLQRCDLNGIQYVLRSIPLELDLEDRFDEIEDAVIIAMDETERTSSMVENLNGRVRKYIRTREEIGHGYLDLLRFFLNHKPILRSARTERRGRTPAEILSGKSHPHWLELLGYERFKRAA